MLVTGLTEPCVPRSKNLQLKLLNLGMSSFCHPVGEQDIYSPDSIPTLAQQLLTGGPTLAQHRQATDYVVCIASANQIMFTNNFFSMNL